MTDEEKLEIFNNKIDEYYLSCLDKGFVAYFNTKDRINTLPVPMIDIAEIYKKFSKKLKNIPLHQLTYKLVDVKLNFCYLKTTKEHFYRGATLIVGNNELKKLNPNTFSLLRENHYRIYLVSVLIEKLLDLLQIIFFDELDDPKKDKWGKLANKLCKISILNKSEVDTITNFKNNRTSELHEFSATIGFLSKSNWNHFQKEESMLTSVLHRIIKLPVE